ncbi:hypothetical protein [Leptolyngbya sp. Heron Island J]|uniref:hypothetical protein n=1 Tax=Leptolyngbya sp. Heron Island J TaxID=1385935 RepID=UPI000684ECFA|nr:hypothetical protein [Leptolyngbya sp. Heron Island J]
MGFIPWWKNEKETLEPSESQLDLLGESQELSPQRKRVDGAIVFRRFTKAIKDNGGGPESYEKVIQAETQELFDCNVRELYEQTGGKIRDRSSLPQPAQEAYMVNESLSANELERMHGTIGGETQEEVDDRIIGLVRQQSRQTRKWLPWA